MATTRYLEAIWTALPANIVKHFCLECGLITVPETICEASVIIEDLHMTAELKDLVLLFRKLVAPNVYPLFY